MRRPGPNDRCPSAPVSIAVALADKLDALISFWSIGEKPTGSRDPYALRRAALGVIRIVVENRLRLPLKQFFKADDLMAFFAERLKVQMREKGVRHDVVDAVFALGDEDDLVRLLARVEALQSFLGTEAGKNLLTAYGRAANIVRAEEKKDKTLAAKIAGAPDVALLEQAEEKAVASALARRRAAVKPALQARGFRRRDAGLRRSARADRRFLRKGHSQCRRQARFAIEQAEIAQPDTGHHGFGGGFFQDRGLTNGQVGLQLRRWQGRGPRRRCAICWAARAPTWRRCRASACRCRRASPSPPRSAPTTTPTSNAYPAELKDEVEKALAAVEKTVGAGFGDANNPLLVSVRSGARASMPGMMDTVLNLGLNDRTVLGLGQVVGRRALRLGQLPPLHPDVLQRRARCRAPLFRGGAGAQEGGSRRPDGHRPQGRRLALGRGRVQEDRREAHRQAVPAGAARAAVGRHRRGVRLVDEPARHHLPPPACRSPRAGAPRSTCRPWCSATWARIAPPASPSRAIPRPAPTCSTANTW